MADYNTGYSTYVVGTSNNAASSLEIILYNRSDYKDIPKISLYNMSQVYSSIMDEGRYARLTRDSTDDPFIYEKGLLENGFTVILYISNVSNTPVGYTEFLSQQGTVNSLNIYTEFNSSISSMIRLELNNSLGQLRNNSTVEKEFSSKDVVYMYTPPEEVKYDISISDSYPRFTSHVYHILENRNMSLKTDQGIIMGGGGNSGKISLNTGVDIDPYGHSYTNFQIGFYGSDIVLYSWKGNMFTIQSLLQRTRFGNPVVYTTNEGDQDYSLIEDLGSTRVIYYFSGRFIVTMTTNYPSTLELYDLERKKWMESKYPNFFLDTLDPRSIVTSIPSNVSSRNISTYIPEIGSIFLDLDQFSTYTNINIVKKIGDWFVLKNRITSSQDFHTYTCIDKTVHVVKLKEKPLAINNSILMVRTIDEKNSLDYYTFYCSPGIEYYTEKARAAKNGSSLKVDNELGILFCDNNDEETDTYRSYYREGKIKVVHSKDGAIGNFLEGFRRGYCNSISDISGNLNIVASIYGMIYYLDKENRNLSYL